jgi:hypothetical protein
MQNRAGLVHVVVDDSRWRCVTQVWYTGFAADKMFGTHDISERVDDFEIVVSVSVLFTAR